MASTTPKKNIVNVVLRQGGIQRKICYNIHW